VALGTGSVLLAAWAIWLIVEPREEIHMEYAVLSPLLSLAGIMTSVGRMAASTGS
jgi:hypothetical protein